MSFNLPLFVAILAGVLATACPGVLESVEARRVRYGFGLTEAAPAGTVLLALEDCRWLARDGEMDVDGLGQYRARVVDCQQAGHRAAFPMSGRGLVADVDGKHLEFNGRQAIVILR